MEKIRNKIFFVALGILAVIVLYAFFNGIGASPTGAPSIKETCEVFFTDVEKQDPFQLYCPSTGYIPLP